jgi:hypothetical protein
MDKQKRMTEDAAFFADFANWPGDYCCVKQQPWVKTVPRGFGYVTIGDPLTVLDHESHEVLGTYENAAAMVEYWSVD